tara:strand:- start:230 stop:766 length:537 start_codon:yes stop_codon:yes gene_type:complete
MKYRLLDEETLGQMIDFLDTIQIEASKGKYKDDIDKINMCSYLISEIINANEAMEIDDEDDIENIKDLKKGDGLFVDIPELNDKDWNKMIEQLDAFFAGWEKSTNKKKRNNNKKNMNKKRQDEVEEIDDSEEEYIPTKHDKFEQYYLEREMRRAIREAKTMDEMLYDLGLDLPPEELN